MRDNSEHKYDDIIYLKHPDFGTHPRMPILDRAAQFAPFAALTGYEDAITETARLTDRRIELDEDKKDILDEKLRFLHEHHKDNYQVSIEYFKQDDKKTGGAYDTFTGNVKKIDSLHRLVITKEGLRIPIDDIIDIQGDFFYYE